MEKNQKTNNQKTNAAARFYRVAIHYSNTITQVLFPFSHAIQSRGSWGLNAQNLFVSLSSQTAKKVV